MNNPKITQLNPNLENNFGKVFSKNKAAYNPYSRAQNNLAKEEYENRAKALNEKYLEEELMSFKDGFIEGEIEVPVEEYAFPEDYLRELERKSKISSNTALAYARTTYSELLNYMAAVRFSTDEEFLSFCDTIQSAQHQIVEGNRLGLYDTSLLSLVEPEEEKQIKFLSFLSYLKDKGLYEESLSFLPALDLDTAFKAKTQLLERVQKNTPANVAVLSGLEKLVSRYTDFSIFDFGKEEIIRLGYAKLSHLIGSQKTFDFYKNVAVSEPEILKALPDKEKSKIINICLIDSNPTSLKEIIKLAAALQPDFNLSEFFLPYFLDTVSFENNKARALKDKYASFEHYVQENYLIDFNLNKALRQYQSNSLYKKDTAGWTDFLKKFAILGQDDLIDKDVKLTLLDFNAIRISIQESTKSKSGSFDLLQTVQEKLLQNLSTEVLNPQDLNTVISYQKSNANYFTKLSWTYEEMFAFLNFEKSWSQEDNKNKLIAHLKERDLHNISAYMLVSYKKHFNAKDCYELSDIVSKKLDDVERYYSSTLAWKKDPSDSNYEKVNSLSQKLFSVDANVLSASLIHLVAQSKINYLFDLKNLTPQTLPDFLIDELGKPSSFTSWANIYYNAYAVRCLKEKFQDYPEGTVLFDNQDKKNSYDFYPNLLQDYLEQSIAPSDKKKNITQTTTYSKDYMDILVALNELLGKRFLGHSLFAGKGIGINTTYKNGDKEIFYAKSAGDFLKHIVPEQYEKQKELFPTSDVIEAKIRKEHEIPEVKSSWPKFLSIWKKSNPKEEFVPEDYAPYVDKIVIKNSIAQIQWAPMKDYKEYVAEKKPQSEFENKLSQQIEATQKLLAKLPENNFSADIKISAQKAVLNVIDLFSYCQKQPKSLDKQKEIEVLHFTTYLFACLQNYEAAFNVVSTMDSSEATQNKLTSLSRETKDQLVLIAQESAHKKDMLEEQMLQEREKEIKVHGTYLENKFKHSSLDFEGFDLSKIKEDPQEPSIDTAYLEKTPTLRAPNIPTHSGGVRGDHSQTLEQNARPKNKFM